MTEAEWLAATDPTPLLKFLKGKTSDRKLRLFGVDCGWRVWKFLDQRGRTALDTAERYADGLCNLDELETVRFAANEAFCEFDDSLGFESAAHAVECLCHAEGLDCLLHEIAWETAAVASFYHPPKHLRRATRRLLFLKQCRLIRDIFGNPFRPVVVDPAWLTSTVVALAESVYTDKALDRLPILADALQDAGCENADILDHCRSEGPHIRGCWALDLVLGKS